MNASYAERFAHAIRADFVLQPGNTLDTNSRLHQYQMDMHSVHQVSADIIRPNVREADRTCMVVPGMHRSGTSALARVLSVMGASLPRTLMAANPTNPTGHWESDAIRELNDELLTFAGRKWNDWTPIEPDFFASPSARAKLAEGRRIVADEYGDAALFVLKDPRIAVLAPFWLEVLREMGVAAAVICPVRHPLEVARSLAVRDGFAIGDAQLIWLRHVLAAEAATRGTPRLYTSYVQLLTDWQEIAARIQRELGVAWPRSISSQQGEVSHFLEASLRHQKVDRIDANTDPDRSGWAWQVFQILSRWAQEGEDANDHPILDGIMNTFDAAAPAFERVIAAGSNALARIQRLEIAASDPLHGPPVTLETAVAAARGGPGPETVTAAEAHAMLAGTQETIAERDRVVAELTDQLETARGQAIEALSREEAVRTDLVAQLAETQRLAAEAHARAEAAGAAQAEQGLSFENAVAALAVTRSENDTLGEQLRHRESQLEQRGEELAQLWAELSDIRSKFVDEVARADSLAADNARQRAQHSKLESWVFRAAGERRIEQQAFAKLRGEVDPLRRERDTLKSAVAARDQTLGELRGRVMVLTQAQDAAERLAADADRRASDAQASCDHHASRLEEARRELAALAQMMAGVQDALSAERERNRERVQAEIGHGDRIARLEADLTEHQRKLVEAEVAQRHAIDAQLRARRDAEDGQAAARQAEDRLREAEVRRVAAEERLRDSEMRHAKAAVARRRTEDENGDLAGKLTSTRSAVNLHQTRAAEDQHQMKSEAETAKQNAEWVRQVTISLSHGRWWWSLLPKHRRRKLARRLKSKGLFDSDAYLALYPDVANCGHSAIEHYLRHGIVENRECPR